MNDIQFKLKKIADEKNAVRKKLRFVALLGQLLGERGQLLPVLVGGSAVEVYTAGNYGSKDIDLVYDDSKALDEILLPLGFRRDGRYWYNDEIDIVVECPGSEPPVRIQKVRLDDADEVFVISLEEIIVDRLCAFKFWRSKKDGEWAKVLLSNGVDFEFLKQRAADEDVLDVLEVMLNE